MVQKNVKWRRDLEVGVRFKRRFALLRLSLTAGDIGLHKVVSVVDLHPVQHVTHFETPSSATYFLFVVKEIIATNCMLILCCPRTFVMLLSVQTLRELGTQF